MVAVRYDGRRHECDNGRPATVAAWTIAPPTRRELRPIAMTTTTRQPPKPGTAPAPDARPTLQLSLPQVVGSALAAATSALAASFLGVAGTLIGAVFGAVIATIGGALYSHSLGVAALRMRVLREVNGVDDDAATTVDTRSRAVDDGEAITVDTRSRAVGSGPAGRGSLKTAGPDLLTVPARRRWLRPVAAMALGVVIALAGITAFELVLGHPVSGSTSSGTSIGQAVRAAPATASPSTSDSTSPASTATASATSTATPSTTATTTSSPSATSSATAPAAGATASPQSAAVESQPAG